MKVGFGLITCQRYPGEERSDARIYADALDLASLAERVGFDSVWVSEHHFVDDGYLPSVLPMCAAIAAGTERVLVGTALLLAPLHDPLRLAEDAAVVDLVSGGRLVLGIGLGWREEEFEGLNVPLGDRVQRLQDTVTVFRQAFSGRPVTGGELLTYPGVFAIPGPSRPGGPPIWIGALSEPAVRRAGRIADGFMATEVTPATLAQQVAWARLARAEAGLDPATLTVSVHLPTFVHEGPAEEAWRMVRPFHRYVAWKYEDMEAARRRRPQEASAPPPASLEEEDTLRAGVVLGAPDEVADRIRQLDDAAGGGLHYIARLYWRGMAPDLQREAVELFGRSVIPILH